MPFSSGLSTSSPNSKFSHSENSVGEGFIGDPASFFRPAASGDLRKMPDLALSLRKIVLEKISNIRDGVATLPALVALDIAIRPRILRFFLIVECILFDWQELVKIEREPSCLRFDHGEGVSRFALDDRFDEAGGTGFPVTLMKGLHPFVVGRLSFTQEDDIGEMDTGIKPGARTRVFREKGAVDDSDDASQLAVIMFDP